MKRQVFVVVLGGVLAVGLVGSAFGDVLTIRDVQYTTDPSGDSPYDGQIHDVAGGIVTHIWFGGKPRIYVQDPAYSQWGGIIVKDWHNGELAGNVSIGDWVSFTAIVVEEANGTTHLQYNRDWAPDASFTVVSTGNPLPDPILLYAAHLAVPVDHMRSEPYESMVVTLHTVLVGERDLGKADDNYELHQGTWVAWGADYMNLDAGGPYDPRIQTGAILERITGIVEQYTKLSSGWDYFQIVTRSASDIAVAEGIPTVSEWGVLVLALLLLTTAKIVYRGRRLAL
jgi:hypothetical protein